MGKKMVQFQFNDVGTFKHNKNDMQLWSVLNSVQYGDQSTYYSFTGYTKEFLWIMVSGEKWFVAYFSSVVLFQI